MILLLTALAGGVGGALRFLVDTGVSRRSKGSLPLGTAVVNVTACLLLGLLTGLAGDHPSGGGLLSVLGVGLMGGYSTFSTASVEGVRLLRAGRWVGAIAHSGGMLVLSLAAAMLGLVTGSLIG